MAGFYAGLCMATCIGLFLFTRVLIPDVMLTFTIALAMWAFLRVLDEEETHPRAWAYTLAASLGAGLLLKSLIALVFPIRRDDSLPAHHPPDFFRDHLEALLFPLLPLDQLSYPAAHRRTLARIGHARQPANLRLYAAQRRWRVSRLPLVLLHQRAATALSQPALPARLRHRAAPLFLVVSSDLALSLERLFPRCS